MKERIVVDDVEAFRCKVRLDGQDYILLILADKYVEVTKKWHHGKGRLIANLAAGEQLNQLGSQISFGSELGPRAIIIEM